MLKVVIADMAKLEVACEPTLLTNIMCCLILEWLLKSAAEQLPNWQVFWTIEMVSEKNVNPSPGCL